MRIRVVVAGAAVAFAALVLPSAGSASTTIGSSLADSFFTTLNCHSFPTGCTASNGPLLPFASRASGGLDAPIDGVVVRWRLKSGATPDVTRLRILRPGNSTTRAAVGTSAPETPTASAISTFATRLPITHGDTIGVDSQGPPVASLATADMRYWAPAIADGGMPAASTSFANSELLVNADIEADADHDHYGDETQDLCPGDATTHDGCLLTVHADKGGSVTGPGIDCPGDCSQAYPGSTLVQLVAHPDRGFGVRSFTGPGCTGATLGECNLTIFTSETVTATFSDTDPPNTTIVKGPKKKSSKRKVKFKFRSDESHSRFQCALDRKKFKNRKFCDSPFKAKVKPGKHVFMVRAVDAGHLADATPAKLKFEVTR